MTPLPLHHEEVKEKAMAIGWDDVGITSPTIPSEDIEAYRQWLTQGHHGEMAYMENQIRCFPEEIFPGAKTVILFVTHYKQEKKSFKDDAGLVASYARGRDYHKIHRKRLKQFIHWLEERCQEKDIARGFSDSFPILEKALAAKAGLGWFGKNTLLIHRKFGTFILLSGVLTSLEIKTSAPKLSLRLPRCGTCQRCLDACPTQAITKPYTLDAKKCLSYHLIESKKAIPEEIANRNPGYIFGCDICQDVCPHNVRPTFASHPEFSEDAGMGAYLKAEDLQEIEKRPEKLYGTPLQRRGVAGLLYNGQSLWR